MKNKTQKTWTTQNSFSFATIPALLATLTGAVLLFSSRQTAKADFTESFSLNASGWQGNNSNPGNPATWATTGGVTGDGDGYITATAVTTSSGAVVLRAQTNLGASPGLFGNWTSTGTSPLSISTLSFDLYQDSSTIQNFGLRFTTASAFPGAFSASTISLPAGIWSHFEVPINSSAFTFPEGGGDYNSILSSIARVQFTVSGTPAAAFNVRLDNVTISSVPEPSSFAMAGLGLAMLGMKRRVKKTS